MATLNKVGMHAPVYVPFSDSAAAGAQVDKVLFVSDDYYELVEARCNHAVDGGALSGAMITKATSGTTIANGVDMIATIFDFTTGALTPQRRSAGAGTLGTTANRQLDPGDTVYLDYEGTLTGLLGVGGCLVLKRIRFTQDR